MDRVLLGTSPVNFTNEAERWEFNNSLDGWSSWPGDDISLTAGPTYITSNITRNSENTPSIYTPTGLLLSGTTFNKIRMKIRKATGPAVSVDWTGWVWWDDGGEHWQRIETIFPEPDWVADGSYGPTGGYSKVVFDMSGVVGWESATIDRMAFTCSQTIDDSFDIGEVSIDDGIPTLSPTYRRGRDTGLFISKPGQNVMSCSDGDLLFDSTSSDFTFILGKGTAIAEKANTISNPTGLTVVSTGIPVPLVPGETDKYETPYIEWSLLHKSSSIDPMTSSFEYVSVPPQIALGSDIGKPSTITSDMNMDITAKQNTGFFSMASTYEVDPLYVPAGRGFDGTHHWVSGDAGETVSPTPPATTRASYTTGTGFPSGLFGNIPEEDIHPKLDEHGNELVISTRKMWTYPRFFTGEYDEDNLGGVQLDAASLAEKDHSFIHNGYGTSWEEDDSLAAYSLAEGDSDASIDIFQGALVLAYGTAHACWNSSGTKVAFNGSLSGGILNAFSTTFAGEIDTMATPLGFGASGSPPGWGSPGFPLHNTLGGGGAPAYLYKPESLGSPGFEERWHEHLVAALFGLSCPLFKTDIFVLDIDDPDNPSQSFGNANTGLPEQITFNNSWGSRWRDDDQPGKSDDWFNGRAHQEEYVRGWSPLGNMLLVERIGYDPTDDPLQAQGTVGGVLGFETRWFRDDAQSRIYTKPYPSTTSGYNDTGDTYYDDKYYNHDDILVAAPAFRHAGHPISPEFDEKYMYYKPNYHPFTNRLISVSSLVGAELSVASRAVTDLVQIIANPAPPAINGFNITDPWPVSFRDPIFDGTAGRPAYGTYAEDPYNTINFFNPVWSPSGKLIAMVGQKSGSDKISFWVCTGFTGIGTPLDTNEHVGTNMRQISSEFTHNFRVNDGSQAPGVTPDEFGFGNGELIDGLYEYGGWGFPKPTWYGDVHILFQNITKDNELGQEGVYSVRVEDITAPIHIHSPVFQLSSPAPKLSSSSDYYGDLCPTVSPNGKWLLHGLNGSTSIPSNGSFISTGTGKETYMMPRETDFRLARINGNFVVDPPEISLEITNGSQVDHLIGYTAFSLRKD
jgi:hypothetical protein